jgi:glycerophosphoryl diester phosphodiesterase
LHIIEQGAVMRLSSWVFAVACIAWALPGAADEPRAVKPFMEELSPLGLHRGGAKWRPEHTVETYLEAWERWPGALLEGDVHLTADGVPVMHHDRTVDRNTNGTGPVGSFTLEELKALDAGYRFTPDRGETFPYRGQGLAIATLEEVLEALPDAQFLLEAKPSIGVVPAMVEVIRRVGAEERVLLASFEPLFMAQLREELPRAAHCFDFDTGMQMLLALREGGETWETFEPQDDVLALMMVFIEQFQVTAEEIAAIREKGVFVQLNTLDTPAEVERMLALGADGLLTDRPDIVAPLLEKHMDLALANAADDE